MWKSGENQTLNSNQFLIASVISTALAGHTEEPLLQVIQTTIILNVLFKKEFA